MFAVGCDGEMFLPDCASGWECLLVLFGVTADDGAVVAEGIIKNRLEKTQNQNG